MFSFTPWTLRVAGGLPEAFESLLPLSYMHRSPLPPSLLQRLSTRSQVIRRKPWSPAFRTPTLPGWAKSAVLEHIYSSIHQDRRGRANPIPRYVSSQRLINRPATTHPSNALAPMQFVVQSAPKAHSGTLGIAERRSITPASPLHHTLRLGHSFKLNMWSIQCHEGSMPGQGDGMSTGTQTDHGALTPLQPIKPDHLLRRCSQQSMTLLSLGCEHEATVSFCAGRWSL